MISQSKMCCWIKLFESPLDCKKIKSLNPKGNRSWIFIGRTDAEARILWLSDVKSWLTGKPLMLGKIEGRRRSGHQRMRWLYGITNAMAMNLSKLLEIIKNREDWYGAVHGAAKSWTWLRDWTTIQVLSYDPHFCPHNLLRRKARY